MSHNPQHWPEKLWALAMQMRGEGKSCKQIAEVVGRSKRAVEHKFQRQNIEKVLVKPSNKRWTAEQRAYMRAHGEEGSDQDLAVAISAIGPERTPEAVKAWRRNIRAEQARFDDCGIAADPTPRDWPVLKGSAEERDQKFVRLVVKEALRIGLIKRAA